MYENCDRALLKEHKTAQKMKKLFYSRIMPIFIFKQTF